MNTFKMRILGLLLAVVGTPSLAWSVDASGFVITDACGSPPFGAGVADMHLHLTRFPKQKQGEELVLNMPSRLGPSGITDWMEIAAQSCSKKSGCTDAHSVRVQVLDSSDAQMTGNFEVILNEGSAIKGSFIAKSRKVKYKQEPICE